MTIPPAISSAMSAQAMIDRGDGEFFFRKRHWYALPAPRTAHSASRKEKQIREAVPSCGSSGAQSIHALKPSGKRLRTSRLADRRRSGNLRAIHSGGRIGVAGGHLLLYYAAIGCRGSSSFLHDGAVGLSSRIGIGSCRG